MALKIHIETCVGDTIRFIKEVSGKGPKYRFFNQLFKAQYRALGGSGFNVDNIKISTVSVNTIAGGFYMEQEANMIEVYNEQLRESKRVLQELVNELKSTTELLLPTLGDHIKQIRDTRMVVVSEMSQSMSALKEIRKFFFESDYEKEMARMERFVKICKEIQMLKADGTFDAICDAAIRLALREEKP